VGQRNKPVKKYIVLFGNEKVIYAKKCVVGRNHHWPHLDITIQGNQNKKIEELYQYVKVNTKKINNLFIQVFFSSFKYEKKQRNKNKNLVFFGIHR
jgi:hypothetical protein